jgi:hypothetical protein
VQGTYQFLAIDGNLGTAISSTFHVTAPASQLQWAAQPPTVITAGQTLPRISAWVEDVNKHVITSSHIVVTLAISTGPTNGKIVGTATANAMNGVVSFTNVSFSKSGTYVLTVTASGLRAALSKKFDVVPDKSAAHLVIGTTPAATVVGRHIPQFLVYVADGFGNIIRNNNTAITLAVQSGPGGTLLGTTRKNASSGVAAFGGLSIRVAGSYVISATDLALANPTPATFALTISPVSTIINRPSVPAVTAGKAFKLSTTLKGAVSSGVAWSGTVDLLDAANNVLATGVVNAKGKVTIHAPGLAGGTQTLSLRYSGDTNHLGSLSLPFKVPVSKTATRIGFWPSAGSISSGSTLTIGVQVSSVHSVPAAPSGTVVLKDNGVAVASLSLDGSSTAVFSLTPAVGTHKYSVVYQGDAYFAGVTSSTKSVVVV